MIVLGLYGRTIEPGRLHDVHDAGASLFIDGVHVCSIQQERLSREKEDDSWPQDAIDAVLGVAGLRQDQVELVAMARTCSCLIHGQHNVVAWVQQQFPRARIVMVPHHHAHAAATFFTSGYDRATVLSFDNGGDVFPLKVDSDLPGLVETGVIGVGSRESGLLVIHSARNSSFFNEAEMLLGRFYQVMATDCYERFAGERAAWMKEGPPLEEDTVDRKRWSQRLSALPGKIMGLAALGDASKVKLPAPFAVITDGMGLPRLMCHPDVSAPLVTEKLSKEVYDYLHRHEVPDVAAWFQKGFEDGLIDYLRAWPFRENYLCLAGGCALNVLANRRILDEGLFQDLYVFPGASDCGLCVGAAAWASWMVHRKVEMPENVAALGLSYTQAQVDQALAKARLPAGAYPSEVRLCQVTADLLTQGKTVGWHQGRGEFGPRALGMRSILADPRRPDIKDHLNNNVKKREWWRPYAPVVMEEHAADWFEIDRPSPYMLLSAKVRPERREQVRGIVHADGTARVQTVNPRQNPILDGLLREFLRRTGVPMLLNTSFNTDGEPIVETPDDAVATFVRSGLDALAIGRSLVIRGKA